MTFQPFDVPTLPIDAPVLVFTIALVAFLFAPLLVRRGRLPGIVGIVIAGAIIGPGGFGWLDHHEAIVLLGEVGLIYLLFTVGLELDLRRFIQSPDDAALFGLLSFFLPFVLGTIAGYYLVDLSLLASLLLASVFASHTLLAYPVVNQMGIAKNEAVTAVFGGILFTDTLALVVLALVLGAEDGTFGVGLILEVAVSLALLFGLVWLVIPRIGRWFFRAFSEESYFEFLFVMAIFFLAASLAEVLDLAGILGAFAAGLALNRLIPAGGPLQNRIEFAGNALFIPFFLLHVGMLVDFGVILDGTRTIAIGVFLVVTMLATKAMAAWVVGAIQGYSRNEVGVIFGLSTGQAAAALAITLLGFEAGLFDTAILNAVVLLLLVTAVLSPWATSRAGNRLAKSDEIGDVDPTTLDPRILLPLTHAGEFQERLVELAAVIKGTPAEEAISILKVVKPGGTKSAEERASRASKELEGLRDIASAAEIPIEIDIRLSHHPADGIAQGVIEERANLLMMGWDGQMPYRDRMFGGVIDHVLDQVSIPTLVAHLSHPINTTTKVYLLLPAGIVHHDGYFEGIHIIKSLVDRLGVELVVFAIDRSEKVYDSTFDQVEPELEADIEAISTWDSAFTRLEEELDEDDLVAVIGAKRGRVGWHRSLGNLPKRLSELPPETFLVLYPREGKPAFDRRFLRFV